MIELIGLTKRFGDKVAVDGLNLTIPAGEIFAFLGPNGAGKTTTIKMIAGLLRPTAGQARLAEFDVHAEPMKAKRLMSYVPDQPYLYEKLTGREFLWLVGDLYGLPREKTERCVARMTDTFDLAGYLDDLTESYSHGMKQRLVLASALLHEPKVLVVDEPMVGLDPRSSRTVKDLFRRLAHEQGVTVFMSTHMLSVAEEVSDRVGIIHLGRIIACGKIEEVRSLGRRGRDFEDLFLELTGGNGRDPGP